MLASRSHAPVVLLETTRCDAAPATLAQQVFRVVLEKLVLELRQVELGTAFRLEQLPRVRASKQFSLPQDRAYGHSDYEVFLVQPAMCLCVCVLE